MNEKPVNPLTLSFLRGIEREYGVYLKGLHMEDKERFAVHKKKDGEPKIGEIISDGKFFDGLELRLKLVKLPGMSPLSQPYEPEIPHGC